MSGIWMTFLFSVSQCDITCPLPFPFIHRVMSSDSCSLRHRFFASIITKRVRLSGLLPVQVTVKGSNILCSFPAYLGPLSLSYELMTKAFFSAPTIFIIFYVWDYNYINFPLCSLQLPPYTTPCSLSNA